MFRLIQGLAPAHQPCQFILCADDQLALKLLPRYDATRPHKSTLHWLPRPRRVAQSYLTSIFTTLWTLLHCLWLLVSRDGRDIDLVRFLHLLLTSPNR